MANQQESTNRCCRPLKTEAVFTLLVFRYHYWAANVQKRLFWMHEDQESLPVWVHLESKASPYSLRSVLCAQLPLPVSGMANCPIVAISLKIWCQFRKAFGLLTMHRNCAFEPSRSDSAFWNWHNKGIKSVNDLYTDQVFSSFTQLLTKYNLPPHNLFCVFQVCDYVKKLFPHFPNRPPETLVDALLNRDLITKGCISFLYRSIWAASSTSLNAVQSAWEESLNVKLTEQQWESVLSLIHLSSIFSLHRLIQCKVFFRTYYTSARLAKIYPSVSDACGRCDFSPANHVHMFWSCAKLVSFWSSSLTYYLGHMATLFLQAVYLQFLVLLPLMALLKIWSRLWHLLPCWPVGWFYLIGNSPFPLHTLAGLLRCSTTWNLKNSGYTKELAEILSCHMGSLSELYTLLRLLLWAGRLISAIVSLSIHLFVFFLFIWLMS